MSGIRAIVLVVLAACNARLGSSETTPETVDASDHSPPDANDVVPSDSLTLSCSNGRVVYLEFQGVTLTKANTDDATQNQAQWLGVTTATVPPFHQTSATRDQDIVDITASVRTILSSFPITVVTTRPAQGPYVLVAFGGTKTIVGTTYGYATSYHDCGDLTKSDVGWVSDTVPTDKVADNAVGAIGWALGLQGTTDPGDCMCGWANNCAVSASHCELHGALPTTTSSSPATTCMGMTTQDETAAFRQAFCQP